MKRAVNLGTPFSPIISQPYLCPKKGKKTSEACKKAPDIFNERRYNKQFYGLKDQALN